MFVNPSTCKNLAELFLARLAATPDAPALSYPDANQGWKTLTWQQVGDRVRCIAVGLLSMGFKKGHRLALYAPTTPAWVLIDTAVLCIGGITVPIYETTPAKEVRSLLQQTEIAFLFVQDQDGWENVLEMLHSLPDLQRVITAEPVRGDAEIQIDLAELESRGHQGLSRANMLGPNAKEGDILKHASQNVENERDACLYHTSGTQGDPQPVAMSQQMLLAEISQVSAAFIDQFKNNEVGITILPYSHVFGRVEWMCHLAFGAHGYFIGGFQTLPSFLKKVPSTVLFTVPRVLEKIRQKVFHDIHELSALKRKIVEKSLEMAQEENASGLKGLLADRLVLSNIREALGGHLHTIITAGAPLAPEISRFFHALGIKVIEAYGLTETAGAICMTQGDPAQFGTVGKPLADCQIRLAHDGEILVQGPNVFKGYGVSSSEGKKEGIFTEQWFHTGDLGIWDENANLVITGRKKDLIITAAGKNIAPLKIECIFSTHPLFEQVVVLGDNKPHLVALFTLNREELSSRLENKTLLEQPDWAKDPSVLQLVGKTVEEINQSLAPFETIKKFSILSELFSVEKGEMTASQKLRRQIIALKHKELFEAMYEEEMSR